MTEGTCELPRALITMLRCEVRTLDDASRAADAIASLCPNPSRQLPGLLELLLNAIEHGNLAIGYEAKTTLLQRGTWVEEIEQRLRRADLGRRRVTVLFERTSAEAKITIRDEGEGFDFRRYLRDLPADSKSFHGRGIAIARELSFDDLEYRGTGSEVIVRVRCEAPTREVTRPSLANRQFPPS